MEPEKDKVQKNETNLTLDDVNQDLEPEKDKHPENDDTNQALENDDYQHLEAEKLPENGRDQEYRDKTSF